MAQLVLDPHLAAVPAARRWVVGVLSRCCTTDRFAVDEDVVELLTSEVVANAVRHGEGPVTIDVACGADDVRIAVTDAGTDTPVVRHVGPEATGGRGMALLDHLATRWGLDRAQPPATGKTVWFRLSGA